LSYLPGGRKDLVQPVAAEGGGIKGVGVAVIAQVEPENSIAVLVQVFPNGQDIVGVGAA